jgi:hypothetical protein
MHELDELTKMKWYKIVFGLKKQFGKKPDLNGILFLIGMNELGKVKEYSKQEKTELLHIATCKLLSYEGHYKLTHFDKEGWPHYELVSTPPYADLMQQENLLRKLIVAYFEEQNILEEYA